MPSVRKSNSADVLFLADHLRAEDVAEVKAASGHSPFEALMTSFEDSAEVYTLLSDTGQPIAMFGLAPSGHAAVGIVWLLATDELKSVSRYFLAHTREYITKFHQSFPILANAVDARNTTHVRWLLWAGFRIITEHPAHGVERRKFYEVVHHV